MKNRLEGLRIKRNVFKFFKNEWKKLFFFLDFPYSVADRTFLPKTNQEISKQSLYAIFCNFI